MARLTLTPAQARSVLEASENRPPGPGHTLARHVGITKAALFDRNNTSRTAGELQLFCAFNTIGECAEALSLTVDHLRLDPQVANFANLGDMTRLEMTVTLPGRIFRVRYSAGEGRAFPTSSFHLAAVRLRARPHGIHVITFYPTLVLV